MRARLLVLVLLLAGCAAASPPASPPPQGPEAARRAVREMLERGAVPGASVAVARDGEIVWTEGLGLADVEQNVAATAETKFGIGSITKSLTTALAARLVDRGLLDLDAPIERYVPEFPHKGQGISVRLVAAHLSGLGTETDTRLYTTATRYETTDAALAELRGERLAARPRERHLYGTASYTLIAAAVERAAKRDFVSAMREQVLEPLGMGDTVPNDRRAIVPNRTAFYVEEGGRTVNAPYFDPSYKLAGAGYLSTAADVARLGAALLRPGFLEQKTRDELFRPLATAGGQETEFALGWRVGKDDRGRRIFYQPGGGLGISSWIVLYPDERLVVAVLTNKTGAPSGTVAARVAEAFL
jgi:CubicO group peptidase (beta-lactamase class C family)